MTQDFKIPSEEELKARLSAEEYEVLRNKGTEIPYTGDFLTKTPDGTFICKVCGQPLFESTAKYESLTGWPSFDQAIPGAVTEKADDSHGMQRTEIVCSRCGSHLGHVFEDGPRTSTGKRYCVNSVCLNLDESKKPAPRAPAQADTEETAAEPTTP
ncbi:peptide-methionine (R)-S-oxide reductase MsrB [Patescibacteria group bacterium]|nr:peptide-methionine (R)-S-oxide reductase MsrB [Patescibacteria group bacterium]